jgi:hypothetical protein
MISQAGSGPPPSIATIGPSGTWTGTAGSGYGGSPPTDPVRTTAKPFIRPLFVENDVFISDRTIVVDAMATAGVTKVRFYCEGNTVDVTSPSWVPYTDVNGVSRLLYGYAVTLNKAAFDSITASGTANIYAEAYPTDVALQNRVIGPFRMHNRAALFAATRTVAPSGADHTTIVAALNWITTNSPSARNCRIQITASGDYALNTAVTTKYDNAIQWVTIEAAGGITANITSGATRTNVRPQYDGLRFKGSGIVLDHAKFATIMMENTGSGLLWIDGVSIQQTGGKFAVFDGTFPQSYWMAMSSGTGRNFYATDCVATGGIYNGYSYCNLARNCSVDDIAGDAFQNNKCIHGLAAAKTSPSGVGGLRSHVAAIDLTYTGAGVPKIAISGAPSIGTGASTRTLQCYVDGVAVGTALTITNPTYSATGSGYTTWATIAAHIDALADFGATVNGAAGARRGASASKAGLTPTQDLANGSGREITFTAGAAQMTSIFDVHGDGVQMFGIYENYGGRFLSVKNVDGANGAQGFFIDQTSTSLTDCQWNGVEVGTDGVTSIANSQVYSAWAHSSLTNVTIYGQQFLMRSDAAAGAKFAPDNRCAFRNFSTDAFSWSGAQDTDLVIDRVNVRTGGLPSGTTNGTTATTNLYTSAPSNLTPVTGGNLLVGGTYLGARQTDGTFNI